MSVCVCVSIPLAKAIHPTAKCCAPTSPELLLSRRMPQNTIQNHPLGGGGVKKVNYFKKGGLPLTPYVEIFQLKMSSCIRQWNFSTVIDASAGTVGSFRTSAAKYRMWSGRARFFTPQVLLVIFLRSGRRISRCIFQLPRRNSIAAVGFRFWVSAGLKL